MGLESTTSIEGLDSSYPLGGDFTNKGDDHLRLLKAVLKATFPGAGAQGFNIPITATEVELNYVGGATSNIQTQIDAISPAIAAAISDAKAALYPVGSIYTNATNATNPATLLGFGTWVAFGAGRVPVGFDAGNALFNAAEKTGGVSDSVNVSHTHGLTDPGHTHNVAYRTQGVGGGSGNGVDFVGANNATEINAALSKTTGITISSAGVSGTDKNYQPFITVYMWKRTA